MLRIRLRSLQRILGIKEEDVDRLADIKGMLESSENGTNSGVSYKGGRQGESFHWSTQSNVPDFLKDKYTTKELAKMLDDKLNGGKVTPGQSIVIKQLLKHSKPLMAGVAATGILASGAGNASAATIGQKKNNQLI